MTQSNVQGNSDLAPPSADLRFHSKYRLVMCAACLNLTLLVIGFVVMMAYFVPHSVNARTKNIDNTKQSLQFAPLHAFPLLPITEFQEIDTVIVPVTHNKGSGVSNNTHQSPFQQRLYRVEAVDQFHETASTRLFLSMGHILDISPSSANLYDQQNKLLSNVRFFLGEKACSEAIKDCTSETNSPPTDSRQLTFNRGGRNADDNSNARGHSRNNDQSADAADEENSDEKGEGGRGGHRLRVRDGSNMAVLSEAAAQGGIVIDASIIEISDVVDGLGTLSGDFGSLGIQGVNGLGGVTGVANGINDFATVTNGLGGVTPIGNSLLGERNVQPGRTFMSVKSVPTVDMTQIGVSTIPALSYTAVPSAFTVPTIAVTTVPWGVNYLPSVWSSSAGAHVAANILCADNLCYSIVP